jgi:hypothetical protein
LTKEKVDLIEDCKTIQYYYTINNMSQKILLDKINIPGIKTYEVYRQNGGYASVEKALKTTPDEVVRSENFRIAWSWWSRTSRNEMEFY